MHDSGLAGRQYQLYGRQAGHADIHGIAGTLTIGSVLNAGSYAAIPIASDGFIAVFGTDFSTATALTTSLSLPATLAGATVTVTDSTE